MPLKAESLAICWVYVFQLKVTIFTVMTTLFYLHQQLHINWLA